MSESCTYCDRTTRRFIELADGTMQCCCENCTPDGIPHVYEGHCSACSAFTWLAEFSKLEVSLCEACLNRAQEAVHAAQVERAFAGLGKRSIS